MASVHKDTGSMLAPYIKALSAYRRTLPASEGANSPAFRPVGVQIRNKEPNVKAPAFHHPNGRPPAEHFVKMLVHSMTANGVKYKPSDEHIPTFKSPSIHPGKALALRSVKSIHLGHPSVKKVVL